jgi:phosphohistidine phosphatase
MKRVYLLRHAKSSWADAALADHERPLNGRGRRAATAMCEQLRAEGIAPALVLCSTARRTRETLERIAPALGDAEIRTEDALYGASAATLLERLRRLPDEVESVLLIGHNPGLQELALRLARPAPALDPLTDKFPTGALAVLALAAGRWSECAPGTAELVAFARPRDLGAR